MRKVLSFQEVAQKRKMVVKIEFTPLSLDRKIFPFKKGFKKSRSRLPALHCAVML